MLPSIRMNLEAARLWLRNRLKHYPHQRENKGQHGEYEETPANDRSDPPTDMSQPEWMAIQAAIREIHTTEKHHQATERRIWAAQIRASRCLNWITAIGAVVSALGLIAIAMSLIIAKKAADDGAIVAGTARQSAETAKNTLIASNRAWLAPSSFDLLKPLDAPDGPVVRVHFQNVGRSPALDVRSRGAWIPVPLLNPIGDLNDAPNVSMGWEWLDKTMRDSCYGGTTIPDGSVAFPFSQKEETFDVWPPAPPKTLIDKDAI